MDTFVSVVIATRNRQALLAQTLDALATQRWPRDQFEIVVADNGSTDSTRLVVESAAALPGRPSVKYLFVAEPGKSYAINEALRLARGSILAFTDDDVQPEPTWLEGLVTAFEDTGADFVAGRVRPIWETPPPEWLSPALYGVLAIPDNGDRRLDVTVGGDEQVLPIGANMAVRARVVEQIGGLCVDLGKLEGTLRTGEDHEFFLRMLRSGCHGVYEPTAVVHHWVPRERLERGYFRRWLYQNGRDVARLESSYTTGVRRLLGVPRYLWRRGAVDAWSAARATTNGDLAARFAAAARLLWLSGYVRELWFGARTPCAAPMRLAEER